MGAYNTVSIRRVCFNCRSAVDLRVQFKYGDTWQHAYRLGDKVRWGGNDIGRPWARRVVVDAAAEPCPNCGFEDGRSYEVWIEADRLTAAAPVEGPGRFVGSADTYAIVED